MEKVGTIDGVKARVGWGRALRAPGRGLQAFLPPGWAGGLSSPPTLGSFSYSQSTDQGQGGDFGLLYSLVHRHSSEERNHPATGTGEGRCRVTKEVGAFW